MRKTLVTKAIGAAALVGVGLVGAVQGCTNLDETPISAITPSNYYRNEAEVLSGLAGVYAQLRSTLDDYYNLSEISTDEMVVPTRGSDWFDGGVWLDIHRQTWTPVSVAGLGPINGAWNVPFAGIARANALLDALQHTTVPNQAGIIAEIRTLRAFYYYMLLDMFGGVPIATTLDFVARPRVSRDSLFKFIEAELTDARANLPDRWGAATSPVAGLGRLTKGAADAILASMYLNAGVFTKDAVGGSGINATAYNSCLGVQVTGGQNACQAAVAAADRILNSGVYQLADDFSQNFSADNATSPENIFVIKFIHQDGLGLNFVMRALHYNQMTPTPWNGFSTLAATYDAFDAADLRRKVFLAGPQVNLETGVPAKDRQGNQLVFTETIANVTAATEGEGVRIYKWPIDPQHVQQENGNDFAWFRLGEIYLIRGEAEFELGNTTEALTMLNAVRARKTPVAAALTAVDRSVILRERLFELVGEGKRRQDLIRFGQYTQPWEFKTAFADFRILMPIPQTQLDANPLLEQNLGY